ncbi:MAG: hypothetical protein JST30_10485 [Armatimonadetes bacterium]|nr:hypothetical protein [Armatimonadota bacterium]
MRRHRRAAYEKAAVLVILVASSTVSAMQVSPKLGPILAAFNLGTFSISVVPFCYLAPLIIRHVRKILDYRDQISQIPNMPAKVLAGLNEKALKDMDGLDGAGSWKPLMSMGRGGK